MRQGPWEQTSGPKFRGFRGPWTKKKNTTAHYHEKYEILLIEKIVGRSLSDEIRSLTTRRMYFENINLAAAASDH